jgi:hypothetical protein
MIEAKNDRPRHSKQSARMISRVPCIASTAAVLRMLSRAG